MFGSIGSDFLSVVRMTVSGIVQVDVEDVIGELDDGGCTIQQ